MLRDHDNPSGPHFEIRVRGPLGPTLRQAFPTLTIRRDGSDALLSGPIGDQSALYGVLNMIESLGLELLEVTRGSDHVPPRPGEPADERRPAHGQARVTP